MAAFKMGTSTLNSRYQSDENPRKVAGTS